MRGNDMDYVEKSLCVAVAVFAVSILPIVGISTYVSNGQSLQCMEINKARDAAATSLLCGKIKR